MVEISQFSTHGEAKLIHWKEELKVTFAFRTNKVTRFNLAICRLFGINNTVLFIITKLMFMNRIKLYQIVLNNNNSIVA